MESTEDKHKNNNQVKSKVTDSEEQSVNNFEKCTCDDCECKKQKDKYINEQKPKRFFRRF